MPNTPVVGAEPWGGRTKAFIVDHSGPASYVIGGETLGQSAFGGPNVFGLAGFYVVEPCGRTVSGNYNVQTNYGGLGVRSSVKLKWLYAASAQGVDSVYQSAAGVGMTPGTYPLVFSGGGGSGAAGTITVSATAATAIVITSPGYGYLSIPTVSAATGGTPLTLLATIGVVAGSEVAAGTNLTGETIRLLALGG